MQVSQQKFMVNLGKSIGFWNEVVNQLLVLTLTRLS